MTGWCSRIGPSIVMAVAALSCEKAQPPPSDVVVTLERTSCFGGCPVYTVSIDRSGNVAYEGALARNGRYELTAHSGSIRLTLPESPGFSLSADTFSGTIRSDLPVTFEDRGPARGRGRRAIGGISRNSIRARFGDGGAELMVRSFSGDIVISKR